MSPPQEPSSAASPSPAIDRHHVGPVVDDARTWGLPDALAVWTAAFVAVSIVIITAMAAGGYDDIDDAPGWFFFLVQAPFPLALAALAGLVVQAKGRGLVRDLKLEFRFGEAGTPFLIGVLTQLILVNVVTQPIIWLFDVDTSDISDSAQELADRASSPAATIGFLVAVCILAPLCEEIFFRGLLFEAFKKRRNVPWLALLWPPGRRPNVDGRRWNLTIAVVLSSAIFSAGHFDLLLFPALMAAGAVFAGVAQHYGRLGPAVWAHLGFNFTTAAALLLSDFIEFERRDLPVPDGFASLLGALVG